MKKLLYLPLLLLFWQCSNPVQEDLINYINVEIPKVADLETEAIDAYESVSGENYESDSTMYYTMTETVVPKYEEFYSILQNIKPSTKEVAVLHKEYVRAAASQLEGFRLILNAIEKQDPEIIVHANENLDEGRALLRIWQTDLDSACTKHNVVFKKEDSEE